MTPRRAAAPNPSPSPQLTPTPTPAAPATLTYSSSSSAFSDLLSTTSTPPALPDHQSDHQSDLLDRLEAIATRPSPPSTVDIDLAVTDGRRAKRKRQVGVMSWSLAALVALSAGSIAAAHHSVATVPGGSAEASGSASSSGSADPHFSAPSVASADPLTAGAKFGWLPSGVEYTDANLKDNALTLTATINTSASATGTSSAFDTGTGASPSLVSLRVFPAGSDEKSALAEIGAGTTQATPTATPQSPIDGRPSYLLADPLRLVSGKGAGTLLWQMSDGTWVEVEAFFTGAAASNVQTTLRHIAETVVPDSSPLALPMRIAGLPDYSTISDFDFDHSSASDWTIRMGVIVDRASLVYSVGFAGKLVPLTLGPAECKTQNGLEVCVTLAAGELPTNVMAAGLQGLANQVTLLGTFPSAWTTEVFTSH